MRILITGGSGFIGKTLTKSLSKDYRIFSPSHKELDILNRSSVDPYIKKNEIEIVIHCAIKGGPNLISETVVMFSNILRNANKLDKIIYFGSGAEYDKFRNLNKVSEEEIGKHIPSQDVGLSKLLCFKLGEKHRNVIYLRPFGVYGKYENYLQAFISNSIAKNLLGLPIKINQNIKFDYLFEDDLVQIVEYFLNHKTKFSDYNITPAKSITLEKIVKIINSISENSSKIELLNSGMNFTYTGNNKRLLTEVKNLTFTPYSIGIHKLFDYHKDRIVKLNKTAIIKDQYLTRLNINETSTKLSK